MIKKDYGILFRYIFHLKIQINGFNPYTKALEKN